MTPCSPSFARAYALVTLLAACGGHVDAPTTSGGDPGGRTNDAGAREACPAVDYCALRCAGEKTPLYPVSCPISSCSCVPVPSRSDWVGVYHVPDKVDAVNLALEADGSFRWSIEGCDFGGGDCGIWKKSQANAIVLQSATSGAPFAWEPSRSASQKNEERVFVRVLLQSR